MRLRIVVGDRNTVRGVVELECARYVITERDVVVVEDTDGQPIVSYLPGAVRSITDVERFNNAFRAGNSDENPGRRQASRSVQAV